MDEYLENQLESEENFPCKGCGEILEEGKAFELAGNRWHLNCFRCNTCGTLLDSDANLLLLGDGSLICNNCTYSCSACGNKIEDLAILTGDQAFCATCFRCRNCKRKIENLRYARTSQGIFCMSCHESLMARRRKKSKAAAQSKAREKDGSPMIVDKSLPALPPNAIPNGAFSNDRVDPESDNTPTELSPRPRPTYNQHDSSGSRNSSRPARSPERRVEHSKEGSLSLPSYRNNRNSAFMGGHPEVHNTAGEDRDFFIPVALDPSPIPSATPQSTRESSAQDQGRHSKEKDYFSISRDGQKSERKGESQTSTPHIAFQEKARQPSSDYDSPPAKDLGRKLSKSSRADRKSHSATTDDRSRKSTNEKSQSDGFKLQDAPNTKKSNTRADSQHESSGGRYSESPDRTEKALTDASQLLSQTIDQSTTSRASHESRSRDEDEVRSTDSSLGPSSMSRPIARKEVPKMGNGNGNLPPVPRSKGAEDYSQPSRPSAEQKLSDTYMAPRAPPAPPTHAGPKESVTSLPEVNENKTSPKLPRWSSGGDFTMEEDMARILGTDEGSSSILRRVSNAVRHGRTNSAEQSGTTGRMGHTRSVSESTRATTSPHWPKTPILEDSLNGHGHGHDITSQLSMPTTDNAALLKRRLRNSENRVAELERQFTSEKDLKVINQKLEEKRKTVSVLDTQTEIMIRQLEVLAGYVEKAKDTGRPVDLGELEESAIKEFVQKLEKLKQSMSASLEQLHSERDELVDEKNRAVADRDRALLEFEQLSSKNAQLADMNNDLTHQIQERFKNHSNQQDVRSPNGLGIHYQHKGSSNHSVSLDNTSIQTGTTLIPDQEEPIVEQGPTVVNIRKGKVQKFSWKKGSKAMAQNIAKGVNRTVGALQQPERRDQQGLDIGNIGLPYNMTHVQVESPVSQMPPPANGQAKKDAEAARQGFFNFNKKANTMPKNMAAMNSSQHTIAEAASVLFGSELSERADFERRQIPCVVTRCIEEVELRGMDTEGIYRKTGGNSQVKMVQDGFNTTENFDISDPDIDITAVTSVLKQYFRKLPTPLLTYEVYDRVLETNSFATDEEKYDHLRKTFNALPQKHKDCLEFLMFHLSRVAKRERENLMSPKNLAVVFAPTIMRDRTIEREMTDMHAKNLAVQFIIENSHIIFSED
ncbi:Rho-type GTPase-activating protein 4 [Apiospora marii]|uniref:Rho-type GTPase-activating protein 4 n=1 Tax=Apiospora marii TaxID=335849 RepID=UPI00312E8A66